MCSPAGCGSSSASRARWPPVTPSSPLTPRTLLSHFVSSEATDRHQRAAQQLATPTDREREVGTAVGAGASTAGIAASST